MRITKRDNARVPWLELARSPADYLDDNTIPEGFKVLDPSKLTKSMVTELWCHWSERARAKEPILIFIKAREQDLGLAARYPPEMPRPLVGQKRTAYVDVESDDQVSDDEMDSCTGKSKEGADKGKGISESSARPPPSKRRRLSDDQSPAANNGDMPKFLYSLSLEPSYKVLLDGVLALPVFVRQFFHLSMNFSNTLIYKASLQSSSLAAKSKFSLPVWVSWDWDEKYLPKDIHTKWDEFRVAVDLLHGYKFADRDEGTLVVLGFGLLLRECWRAVEVEDDDETSPEFLRESLLGKKRAMLVIKVIKEVIGRFPLPDADEERPREKESEGSVKGKKARAGQKKPATKKSHIGATSPVPSTSKRPADTGTEAGQTRSQRQRKPSKKLRGD